MVGLDVLTAGNTVYPSCACEITVLQMFDPFVLSIIYLSIYDTKNSFEFGFYCAICYINLYFDVAFELFCYLSHVLHWFYDLIVFHIRSTSKVGKR